MSEQTPAPDGQDAIPPSANANWPGRGLVGWFVKNPVAANLLMILFLVGGAVTASTIRTEVFPTLSPGRVRRFRKIFRPAWCFHQAAPRRAAW